MENENIRLSGTPEPSCQLFTGGHFNYADPMSSCLNIQDIAHALSQQCRFNGHLREFYSVAEHSILCYEYLTQLKDENGDKVKLSAKTLMYGLLHDAAEAVISDIPAPFKMLFPELKKKEDEYLEAIFDILGLDMEDANKVLVKQADRYMVLKEARDLLNPATRFRGLWGPWIGRYHDEYDAIMSPGNKQPDIRIRRWSPAFAERKFIDTYNELIWQRP